MKCCSKQVEGTQAIVVEHDLNTLGEELASHAFDTDTIRRFFTWARGESDHVLGLYFPNG